MGIASGIKDITQDIASSYDVRASEVGKLKDEAKKMLESFRASQKELTQGVAARKSEIKDMLGDFQRSRKQANTELRRELADYDCGIKSEVAKIRQETQADLREASATWQGLAETMRAKRSGVKAPPKVKPTVEEKVEVPPAEEEIPDLEAKLLDAVREHPEGITLAEVAESLGVVPIVLGRASRKLLDGGKIRKEDKDYFPVTTE
jgi:hypothetical protein